MISIIDIIFKLIYLILIVYVFLSWFPNIQWHKQPFYGIRKFADFIFAPFRSIIPPIGMIDVSPIVAFIFLTIVEYLLKVIVHNLGF